MNRLNGAGLSRPGRIISLALAALAASPAPGAAPESVTLVDRGRPRAAIVLSGEALAAPVFTPTARPRRGQRPNPLGDERLAAQELRDHLRAMSGAELPIVPSGAVPEGAVPIRIGGAADASLDRLAASRGSDPGAFALVVQPDGVAIRGLSPEGTLFGVYELLEQLGVRWFLPGELGRVVPESPTVRAAVQRTVQCPSFPARRLQAVSAPQWERRMRLGGPYFPASHGVPGFGARESERLFQEHPEYFALVDGRRTTRQLCVSHPEVVKIAIQATKAWFRAHPEADIMGIGANDGRGFCECDACRALDGGDYDPFGHYPSMTDRYVWFFNQVLKGIEDEFPDKRLGFYAYSVYNRPPVRVKPSPKLVPAVALINLCRLHGMNNPVCPEKNYEQWIIRRWGELVPEVYYRGYWFNLADPGLPFFMIERLRRDVPLGKQLGVAGWRVEAPYEWAASTPSRYVAARLMWDHRADVDRLLDDFYPSFFGPAAAPMRRYIERMGRALDTADYHTGSSWDLPHVYDEGVRRAAGRDLKDAVRAAPPDSLYARRIAMYADSFAYLEAFIEMLETRARHDYAASHQALQRMAAIREKLAHHDPPLIGKHAESYLERFFARATREGFERTRGGGRLLAGLDDRWQFQIDPEGVGEAIGWWRPDVTGGNWRTIRTSTLSWSSQGLRYYKGLAWYRQTALLPADAAGRRVWLWCGGVDEQAKVWVNGQLLGESPRGAFRPFEMDATDAVRPGELNTVVLCVSNLTLNELGTGGVTGPVMFYAR